MPTSRLGRLAALAHRRRGRMVLAWIAALVAVALLAPPLADDAASDFSTPDSESARVEQLLATEFPGRTGDVLTVAWESPDAAAALPAIERFAAGATRLEGVGELQPPHYSRDGTIAVAQMTLSERGFSVPAETGEQLIALAEQASGNGLRIALGGAPVQRCCRWPATASTVCASPVSVAPRRPPPPPGRAPCSAVRCSRSSSPLP